MDMANIAWKVIKRVVNDIDNDISRIENPLLESVVRSTAVVVAMSVLMRATSTAIRVGAAAGRVYLKL